MSSRLPIGVGTIYNLLMSILNQCLKYIYKKAVLKILVVVRGKPQKVKPI